ncbi:MAG TPA: EF-hand domain-containing protein [Sphingomicrobium sp.]|nr:EF-hand domain-containing protein [Sphingomicrobium sp.]
MPIPAVLIALAAQTAAQPSTTPVTHHWGVPFISPMGEPFRAGPGGDALADWFDQADTNHDGYLTVEEMQQDAARFFAALDVNHDGEIDPDEITRYETVVAPEIDTSPGARIERAQLENREQGGSGRHGHGGGRHHGADGFAGAGGFSGDLDDPLGGGRFGLLNIPEPVASADADFNRGVSLDEFKHAALQRFNMLDTGRSGRLTLGGLEEQRAAIIAAARRPHGASAQPSEGDIESGSPY